MFRKSKETEQDFLELRLNVTLLYKENLTTEMLKSKTKINLSPF